MSDETTQADPQAAEKERLALELYETHAEIQRLEKKKSYLKDQLDPLLAEGERVADCVEKTVKRNLAVGSELLDELEAKYGPSIVKRSVNTPALRKIMAEDKELDDSIPRKKSVSIRVGEKWGG